MNNEHREHKNQRRCFTPRFQALVLFIYLPQRTTVFTFTLLHSLLSSSSSSSSSLLTPNQNPERERERETTTKLSKMLLGKRPRPPMKRTTSMSEITLDLNAAASDAANQRRSGASGGALTPKILRRHSSDLVDTPHFLRVCALCKGRLAPGRDIYMYRYNSVAFPTVPVSSIIYLFINSQFHLNNWNGFLF